ncbi:MAG: hypothetical protein U5L45_13500 [Saprospiraceae bacterium]|nr:hypothetical protein [Saprospiraceae bacterium]
MVHFRQKPKMNHIFSCHCASKRHKAAYIYLDSTKRYQKFILKTDICSKIF